MNCVPFYCVMLVVALTISCTKTQLPEGYWQASPSEKNTATSTRILTIGAGNWTHLSTDLSLFQNLERLNAANNQLEEIPVCITELQKLERLNLSNNKLHELPQALTNLKELKRVDISNNIFAQFPKQLLTLSQLEVLDLRYNKLSELPQELTNLKKLNAIYIGGNNFTEEQRKMFRKWLPYTKIILRSDKRQ